MTQRTTSESSLAGFGFQPAVEAWFTASFSAPTPPQQRAWPVLRRGDSTLLLAPTGSGKTLAAFLHAIDRLMFTPPPQEGPGRCRVLYLSPIKALAVDVERNLRAPLVGIAREAGRLGHDFHLPDVVIRTGDTPQKERARFARNGADILITTPESLYLLLTSAAREALRAVETVIVDEIHALVPTKRGAHLALSLERLERLTQRPLQRIGLSATQRPLDEVARFLGGHAAEGELVTPRPVTILDASGAKQLKLSVEVPVEDMARPAAPAEAGAAPGLGKESIWAAIHPRLLEVVRAHRSTLLFVNSRRGAERLAGALNELAGEVLVHAHHGSLSKDQRAVVEEQLKLGRLKGLVATSSLELGIDMGAVDVVVQIEAPPSVASALQRIGRAGHQVGAVSEGVLFPKYRGDLLACAALTAAMQEGAVESTRYPRNPLDVLAQQLVAAVSLEPLTVDSAFNLARGAAPFADLSRQAFEGVLDLLSGRYPSTDFSELKPRLTWDRIGGRLTAREGARRVAIVNGGTIPDRGLYGVFLLGAPKGQARVGELDEEMVFESRRGETFVLGASTWRIEDITFDRVLVSPAPGEPGKMPFWRGEQVARPLEFGRRIGALARTLLSLPASAALSLLTTRHGLDESAARNALAYLKDQQAAGAVPDDTTIVVERGRDELGDWRVCVLSPLGGQVLAPWSMALSARLDTGAELDVETMWTNDGFIVRLPESEEPPDVAALFPAPEEVEALVMQRLAGTPLFAARFRENAARALLLPRKRPGQRTPLWQLRKKAQELLAAASRYPAFPVVLETYRECLKDVFDMPALKDTLAQVQRKDIRVVTVDAASPSPFAAALLFGYVNNFIYEGDAPLQERRAQALSIDAAQLQELLGEAELRTLLDADVLATVEESLQHLSPQGRVRTADGVNDLLLRLGDLAPEELSARAEGLDVAATVKALVAARRLVQVQVGGQPRLIAVEDASRYRDALGVPLPPGLAEAFLAPGPAPLEALLVRYARTHGPFSAAEVAARFGLSLAQAARALDGLVAARRLLQGGFRPGGSGREYVDAEVLARVRRASLARLRREVEPVEAWALGKALTAWQGVARKRRGLDALLDVVERLQGLALPASLLETELLPARLETYLAGDLDALASAGEVVWVGLEPLGERDGRIALYLTDHLARLHRPTPLDVAALSPREARLVEVLGRGGASFFGALHDASGGGFAQETVEALWALVWKGLVTNDAFYALRALTRPVGRKQQRRLPVDARAFRSRRATPAAAEGRWSLLSARLQGPLATPTEWAAGMAQQLLNRYGLVTREVAQAEGLPGGFSAVYDVFKALEESGRVRRGYFVSGVAATQFCQPAALELLRGARPEEPPQVVLLSAVDPANPYGALLPWPPVPGEEGKRLVPMRAVGAQVVLVDGAVRAWLSRGGRQALCWLPEGEPERAQVAAAVAERLAFLARRALERGEGQLLGEVNGGPAEASVLAPALLAAGFSPTSTGLQMRRAARPPAKAAPTPPADEEE